MNIENYTRQVVLNTGNKINTYAVKEKYAQTLIKAIQQGLISRGNKGIKDNFVPADDMKSTTRVLVLRQIPHEVSARSLGDPSINGGYGDSRSPYIASTENVWIDCLNYFDRAFVVPEIQENLIDIDVLAGELTNYELQVVLDINGGTLAKRLEKSYFGSEKRVVEWDTTKNISVPLGKAITELSRGDKAHGFGYFPYSTMLAGVSITAYDELLGASLLVGGNLGTYNEKSQEMVAKGVISPDANLHFEDDGYCGQFRNVDFHILSDSIVSKAEEYLGLCDGDLLNDEFIGFVGTAMANARGISALKDLKVIDYQGFRGKLIQPLINYGCEVFYPKGNVFVFKQNAFDTKTKLANYWAGALEIKAKPAGSRAIPVAEMSAISTSNFTANIVCQNSNDTSLVENTGYYVQSDVAITSFKDFDTAYNASSAVAGTFTSGTKKTEGLTSGKYLNCLVAGVDGTLKIYSFLVA